MDMVTDSEVELEENADVRRKSGFPEAMIPLARRLAGDTLRF